MCPKRFLSILGPLLVLVTGLLAGPPPLTITDSGYYITQLDDAGRPSLVRLETVVDLRTGTTPETPDPDTDPPADLSPPPKGISADVAEWSSDVGDPQAAQEYALVFETVRDGVSDGLVTSDTLFPTLRKAADSVVDDRWDTLRRKLGDHLTEQLQNGDLGTKTQIANTLELIRYGLAYSARGSQSISGEKALAVVAKVNSIISESGE